jgi:hypothetical protein
MSVTTQAPPALQDILAMEEPERTHTLQAWVGEYDYKHGGNVLLKMASGRGAKLKAENGEVINIPPRGHRVAREVALRLMLDFGRSGQYYGIDRATGVTPAQWRAFHPDTKKAFEGYEFQFMTDYVIHVPDLPNIDAEDEGELDDNGPQEE